MAIDLRTARVRQLTEGSAKRSLGETWIVDDPTGHVHVAASGPNRDEALAQLRRKLQADLGLTEPDVSHLLSGDL